MNTFLEKEFGISVINIKRLNGYDNVNYHISTREEDFIYKTYTYSGLLYDLLKAENETLLFLTDGFESKIPKPIPFKDGLYLKTIDNENDKKICRLLSYLEGEFLGEVEHSNTLFESLGAFLAKLDLKLKTFKNHTIQARQWEWDIQYLDLNRKYINDIPNAKDRNTVLYFFKQFEEIVRPFFPELRKQIIYNDANEWNLLVKNGRISGIIDFGDLAHSFLINELAVAITYAC